MFIHVSKNIGVLESIVFYSACDIMAKKRKHYRKRGRKRLFWVLECLFSCKSTLRSRSDCGTDCGEHDFFCRN